MQYDHNPMPLNGPCTAIEPWACEAGCGHFCDILSVDVSSRFLKVKFCCPTCGNEATLNWDLAKHDWVETVDLRSENTNSVGEFVGSFNYEAGPFDVKKFGRRIGLDDIEEIVTTPSDSSDMTEHQLYTCFKCSSNGPITLCSCAIIKQRNLHASRDCRGQRPKRRYARHAGVDSSKGVSGRENFCWLSIRRLASAVCQVPVEPAKVRYLSQSWAGLEVRSRPFLQVSEIPPEFLSGKVQKSV